MANNVLEFIIKAKDSASGVIGAISGKISGFASTVGRNLMNIESGFRMLGKAATALAVPLATAFRREAMTVQFAVLFKSLKQAKAHMVDLADFAAKTPFQLNGITAASRQLYVFSSGVLGSKDTLRLVGDAASAVGTDLEGLSFWVGRAYSMIAGGKPFGEAAMRLQELGVLTPQVRQKMEDLQASGASSADVWMQLRNSLEAYSGGMNVASKTGEGLVSTLKDVGEEAKATFGKAFMESAKGGIQYFIDLINGFISDGTITKWAERTRDALLTVFGAMKGLSDATTRGDTWEAVKDVLMGGFEIGATKAVNILSEYLPKFGVMLGKLIKDGVAGIFKNNSHDESVQAATELGILKPGSLKSKLHQDWWNIPDNKREDYEKRVDELKAEKYKITLLKSSDRMSRGISRLKTLGSDFEDVGKSIALTEADFNMKGDSGSDPERILQRKKEIEALVESSKEANASKELERIEKVKKARLKLETEIDDERTRLAINSAKELATTRLGAANTKADEAWENYSDRESYTKYIAKQKADQKTKDRYTRDIGKLTDRYGNSSGNLELSNEERSNLKTWEKIALNVYDAEKEKTSASNELKKISDNTAGLAKKMEELLKMKG